MLVVRANGSAVRPPGRGPQGRPKPVKAWVTRINWRILKNSIGDLLPLECDVLRQRTRQTRLSEDHTDPTKSIIAVIEQYTARSDMDSKMAKTCYIHYWYQRHGYREQGRSLPLLYILNYTGLIGLFPASSGSRSYNLQKNSTIDNMIPPVFSSFYNNPCLKDVQAFYAKESPISSPDPITSPAILTPSPVLPPSLLFDPRYFFVPEELLPPKKRIHSPSSSSTTLSNSSRNQTCNLVSPSFSVYTSTPPQVFEIGKCSDKMYLKHHEKQVEDILNYLDELHLHRIERMEEERTNGNELKTKLKRIRTQIIRLQKKRMPPKRTSTSETLAITLAAIWKLINDGISLALKAQAASMARKELAVLDTTGYHIRELIEAFIRGLPQSIEGNVTASKPQTMVEATNIDKANGSDINIIRLQEQSDRNEF
ncbi:hypothetical protein Tco_1378630 [Tanacetum coccineum]